MLGVPCAYLAGLQLEHFGNVLAYADGPPFVCNVATMDGGKIQEKIHYALCVIMREYMF
jgi:hypothetical protein